MLTIDEQAQMLQNFFNYAQGIEPVLNTPGLKLVWAGFNYLLQPKKFLILKNFFNRNINLFNKK